MLQHGAQQSSTARRHRLPRHGPGIGATSLTELAAATVVAGGVLRSAVLGQGRETGSGRRPVYQPEHESHHACLAFFPRGRESVDRCAPLLHLCLITVD